MTKTARPGTRRSTATSQDDLSISLAGRSPNELTRPCAARLHLLGEDPALVVPKRITIASGLDLERARYLVRVARGLYTAWDTGLLNHLADACNEVGLARAARATASVRAAVPDLRCDVDHLVLEAQGFSARLRFTGHFTGVHRGVRGSGLALDTTAYDVQTVPSRIAATDCNSGQDAKPPNLSERRPLDAP